MKPLASRAQRRMLLRHPGGRLNAPHRRFSELRPGAWACGPTYFPSVTLRRR